MIFIYSNKQWRPSEVKDVMKGDFFKKKEADEMFWIAASDARLINGKWRVETEKTW